MTSELNQQRINTMQQRLNQALQPTLLEIIDESHLHVGHAGAQSGAGHFKVTISSVLFQNKNQLACHRLIYSALGDLMSDAIHALRIMIVPIAHLK